MVRKVFVQELAEGQLLNLGEGVDWSEGGRRAVLKFDLMVVSTARGQRRTFALAEHVQVFVVGLRNTLVERFVFERRVIELGGGGSRGDGGGINEAGKEDGGIVGLWKAG